jgi:hypothetical protein
VRKEDAIRVMNQSRISLIIRYRLVAKPSKRPATQKINSALEMSRQTMADKLFWPLTAEYVTRGQKCGPPVARMEIVPLALSPIEPRAHIQVSFPGESRGARWAGGGGYRRSVIPVNQPKPDIRGDKAMSPRRHLIRYVSRNQSLPGPAGRKGEDDTWVRGVAYARASRRVASTLTIERG